MQVVDYVVISFGQCVVIDLGGYVVYQEQVEDGQWQYYGCVWLWIDEIFVDQWFYQFGEVVVGQGFNYYGDDCVYYEYLVGVGVVQQMFVDWLYWCVMGIYGCIFGVVVMVI